ncbi:C6 transcription factor [Purpureocillium lavendulum]|uniref:C6 transcription factor n=1 Tax=Purpureocillium lavendulum TaxID=1247861 RepID=A0AB34G034_9HYPO|nr:C6 transcription factor [Purpureocillium lavendulum]
MIHPSTSSSPIPGLHSLPQHHHHPSAAYLNDPAPLDEPSKTTPATATAHITLSAMGSHNLPSPPAEEGKLGRKGTSTSSSSSSSKSTKPSNRASKRANSGVAAAHHHDHVTHAAGMDGRHKRVWKACERCRMKKTKCDGEFPCKRCKDDGVVCTAGVRKKVEYKQLPKGYAEVLENTQFALIATVHKLYSMVRSSQPWTLGEPELNDRGQPVIHNIAQKLGCIRPNSDIDLPVHSVFPEDEAGMAELARQLEEQQQSQPQSQQPQHPSLHQQDRHDRASSSEFEHSDSEQDYRFGGISQNYRSEAFGSGSRGGASSSLTMSPHSAGTTATDYELSPTTDIDTGAFFPSHSHSHSQQQQGGQQQGFQGWSGLPPSSKPGDMSLEFFQGGLQGLNVLNQGLVDGDYGIKPDILSVHNPDVMMGMNDPMIYAGFDGEAMRL